MNGKRAMGLCLTACMLLSCAGFAGLKPKMNPAKVKGNPVISTKRVVKPSTTSTAIQDVKNVSINIIKADVGKEFRITLDQNITTGYSWVYKANSDTIKLTGQETIDNHPDGICGAPSQGVWIFSASVKGKYEIIFTYARHWDKADKAVKTVKYSIIVTDVKDAGATSKNTNIIGMPNPLVTYKTVVDARNAVGFQFAVPLPTSMPEHYSVSDIIVISGKLAEIFYDKDDHKILYRTSKVKGDISGDYNVYDTTNTVTVGSLNVACRGTKDGIKVATWSDGDTSYSLSFDEAVSQKELIAIIENIK